MRQKIQKLNLKKQCGWKSSMNQIFRKLYKKVNLKEHSNVSAFDGRTLTYCESIISSWNVVFELASNLLMMPVVQEDAELMFQLNYLVTESVLHTIFDLSKNMDISDIRPECYYGLNQIGDDVQKIF